MLETTEELEELSKEVRTTASPERLQTNAQTISDLVASGLSASALREGDVVPDFALPDTHGHVLALKTLLDRGPVVISFYRGGWCPFCNLELRGLQRVLPEIVQLGDRYARLAGDVGLSVGDAMRAFHLFEGLVRASVDELSAARAAREDLEQSVGWFLNEVRVSMVESLSKEGRP